MWLKFEKISVFQLLLIVILICIVLLSIPYNILNNLSFFGFSIDIDSYSKWGDFVVGITSPVLSLFIILLVFKTFKVESKDLSETKAILNKQNNIIENQNKIAIKQNEIILKQLFESTFFKLLELYQVNLEKNIIKVNKTKKEYRGVEFLNYKYSEFVEYFGEEYNTNISVNLLVEKLNGYKQEYRIIIERILNQFMRLIFTIEDSEISNKDFYFQILKETLSHQEQSTILFGCLLNKNPQFNQILIKENFWNDSNLYAQLEKILPELVDYMK